MNSRLRAIFLTAGMCVGTVFSPCIADADDPTNTIAVTADKAVIDKPLPFDVPLVVQLKVDSSIAEWIRAVESRYVERERLELSPIGGQWWSPLRTHLREITPSQRVDNTDGLIVAGEYCTVAIPPLRANRYYQYAFTIIYQIPQDQWQPLARQALDTASREMTSDVIEGFSEQTRKKLIGRFLVALNDALPKKPSGAILATAAGSVFDTTDTNAGREARNALKLDDNLFMPLRYRHEAIEALNRRSKDAAVVMEFTEAERFLLFTLEDDMIRRFGSTTPSAIRTEITDLASPAMRLSLLVAPSSREAIASGHVALRQAAAAAVTGNGFDDVWALQQAEERRRNILASAEDVARLHRLVLMATQVPGNAGKSPDPVCSALTVKLRVVRDKLGGIGTSADFDSLASSLRTRNRNIERVARELEARGTKQLSLQAKTVVDFQTNARQYVSADIGLLYGFQIDETVPYLGANFYLKPVNKEAHFGDLKGSERFWKTVSLTIGLTMRSVEVEGERDDLIGSSALLIGVGLRVGGFARLSGGALIFKKDNPNPLITDKSTTADAYVSASIDWDVRSALGDLLSKF